MGHGEEHTWSLRQLARLLWILSLRSLTSSPSRLRSLSLRLATAMAVELELELRGHGRHEPWARAPRPWPMSSRSLAAKLEPAGRCRHRHEARAHQIGVLKVTAAMAVELKLRGHGSRRLLFFPTAKQRRRKRETVKTKRGERIFF
ncbi:uncharacterized protein J3R85_011977 [Psidium guajava]|nr:uncharacterized protein J3R85_011977 [Psidium guajava]